MRTLYMTCVSKSRNMSCLENNWPHLFVWVRRGASAVWVPGTNLGSVSRLRSVGPVGPSASSPSLSGETADCPWLLLQRQSVLWTKQAAAATAPGAAVRLLVPRHSSSSIDLSPGWAPLWPVSSQSGVKGSLIDVIQTHVYRHVNISSSKAPELKAPAWHCASFVGALLSGKRYVRLDWPNAKTPLEPLS